MNRARLRSCLAMAFVMSAAVPAWADVALPKGFKPTVPFVVSVDENALQPKLQIPQKFLNHRVGMLDESRPTFRTAMAGAALSVGVVAALFLRRRRSNIAAVVILGSAALLASATALADIPGPGGRRRPGPPQEEFEYDPRFSNVPVQVVVEVVAQGNAVRLIIPPGLPQPDGAAGAPAPTTPAP